MRREKVQARCLFPKRKPRHERCNLRDMVRKAEEDYIDFQDVPWIIQGFHGSVLSPGSNSSASSTKRD